MVSFFVVAPGSARIPVCSLCLSIASARQLFLRSCFLSPCALNPAVFFPPQVGEHTLELFLMCDSYVGCDQEYAVDLMVGAAASDDESDEE